MSVDSGIDESMRLNWSILNNGFINGMQAVMMLILIETLCDGYSEALQHIWRISYCPQIVGSTLNPDSFDRQLAR